MRSQFTINYLEYKKKINFVFHFLNIVFNVTCFEHLCHFKSGYFLILGQEESAHK